MQKKESRGQFYVDISTIDGYQQPLTLGVGSDTMSCGKKGCSGPGIYTECEAKDGAGTIVTKKPVTFTFC